MVHLQDPARRLVGCGTAWMVIDSAAVVLRLLAKRNAHKGFATDDAWCILALVLTVVFNMLQIIGSFTHVNVSKKFSLLMKNAQG